MQQSVLQILTAEGVKGYRNARFWSHAPNVLTGSIHIQATEDANEQQVIRQVNQIFTSIGFTHFTTQLEKDEFVSRKSFSADCEGEDYVNGGGGQLGSRILLDNSSLEGFGSDSRYTGIDNGLEQVNVVGSSVDAPKTGTENAGGRSVTFT